MSPQAYPALYLSTDAAAVRGRRTFLLATAVRMVGLAVAAASGAFVASVGNIDAFGLVALAAFLVAVSAEVYLLAEDPERLWFTGRAAAESAKTITWRYVAGGMPFPISLPSAEVDASFVERLNEVTRDIDGTDVAPVVEAASQITETMRDIRNADLVRRRRVYQHHRIEEQRAWYASHALAASRAARRWTVVLLALEGTGGLAAGAKALALVELDLLGLLATAGTALLGWMQARQYRQLACAYGVAAQELASINALIASERDESEWARFVDEAEAAISREHTLWRSSRALRARVP